MAVSEPPDPTKLSDAGQQPLEQRLSLWDAVSIIIGIVVGTSIFVVSGVIANQVAGTWEMLLVWGLGGVLSFVGALCYAELATTYPRSGGDYIYLTQAFGRFTGFMFGWSQLAVLLTGSIGAMSFAFADYAVKLIGFSAENRPLAVAPLAVGAVIVLTLINLGGVACGKNMQNVLTVCKVVGLGGILFAGFTVGGSEPLNIEMGETDSRFPGFGLALILVLYAYGGWNDSAFVAAEVRDRQRNIPRALLLGIGAITLLYLLINFAYAWGLGFAGLRDSSTPAASLLDKSLGEWGGRVMSALVAVSALGAMNGLIFTGSRVYAALGQDHRAFALLGRWNHRGGAPLWSLTAQAVITCLLVLAVGTETGRSYVDRALIALHVLGDAGMPWETYYGGFNTLVAMTAPAFWLLFLLTGLSLFKLREMNPDLPRPFSVPWYPLTPFAFCATSLYMLYASISYAGVLTLLGLVPVLIGVPLYFLSHNRKRAASESD